MKKRKRSDSRNLRSTPAPLDFVAWRKRFEASLVVGTRASKAFRELLKKEAQSRERLHLPKLLDLPGYVMEGIYRETSTLPEQNDRVPERLAKLLKGLVEQLGFVIGTITTAGAKVESQAGVSLDLSTDLHLFHKARNSATATLELLEVKGPESMRRDAADQCLSFLLTLEGLVPESQANDLAQVALKAHGYTEDALTDLAIGEERSGKVRKRKDALRKRYKDTLVKMNSFKLRQ
jgi:hypothetical protein